MHLDSNSLFESIGLNEQLTFQKPHRLLNTLEIQVSEDQVCKLEVREHDDPYLLALSFCSRYQLNQIAIQVIQKKVQEILDKDKQMIGHVRTSNKHYKQRQKEKNNGKDYYNKQTAAKDTKKKNNHQPQPQTQTQPSTQTKSVSDIGQKLYQKGIKALYKNQKYRMQQQLQKQAEDRRQLTFKPKINQVSEKIVEIRKMLGGTPSQHRLRERNVQKVSDQLQQCTFKPTINKQSQRIVQEKFGRSEEDFVEKLYYDSIKQEVKRNKRKELEKEQYTYKPTINQKSRIQVRDTFMERLEKDLKNKKEKQLKTQAPDEHCSFTPQIGRPPKIARNKENRPIGEYLSKNYETRSKSQLSRANFQSISESMVTNKNSQNIYQNLVKKRIEQLFELLDGNKDGFISPDHIDIQQLSPNSLMLLQPFFKQMQELGAVLDQNMFARAINKLLDISPQNLKGQFISERWKKQPNNKYTFKPKLNNKSARLAQDRAAVNLYQQGIQAKRRKQVYTALLQAKKQEQQLQQCTFKPLLSSGSQIYAQRYLQRRNNDDSLQRDIYSDQNQQI